ncbi:MAG TPA: alanine dehydrogenase, partial [Bacteroidales bacterium]|nr:alanine dehydrogenase [Bacteroidales bacterium]
MNQEHKEHKFVSLVGGYQPQEETLGIEMQIKKLTIGLPLDRERSDSRVALAPNAAGQLIRNGHKVLMEAGAGEGSWFTDSDYSENGVELVGKSEVFQAGIILKVAPITHDEILSLTPRSVLVSSLHLNARCDEYFRRLMAKRITAIAFEYLQDRTGAFPIRRAMSEIAGNASVMVAGELLSHPQLGKGHILGGYSGVSPTEVVIIGAGTVGEFAARTAIGLGANVKVFDNAVYKLRTLQSNLQNRVFTSIVQPQVLKKALQSADVLITAVHTGKGRTPIFVSAEMVSTMKQGSVIVDVSIDQGGCVETSRLTTNQSPVFVEYGVLHYCVPNIASRYSHTASYAISNVLTPLLV